MAGNKDAAKGRRLLRARMTEAEPEQLRPRDANLKLRKKSTSYDCLKTSREKNTENQRMKRTQMSEEEKERVSAAQAEQARKLNRQNKLSQESRIQERRNRDAELKRKKRAQMSEEEKERERARQAEQARKRRALKAEEGQAKLSSKNKKINCQNKLSKESRYRQLRSKDAELKRKKRAEMTEEEKNEVRTKWAEVQRKKRAALSEEERKQNRAQWAEEKRRKRALLSKEEKKKINAQKTQRLKIKENETNAERIKRLYFQTGVHINKNPDRYQIVGTFVKNAFCSIKQIHSDVELLKNNFKLCLVRAIKYVVSSHLMEKRGLKAPAYQSLTYVEITPTEGPNKCSQSPFFPDANETDPLVDESVEKKYSNDMANENVADDFNFEDFTLFTHDSPSTCEKNTRRTSTAEKFDCTMCSKKFATSMGLIIHQKSHKTNCCEFKCCVCSQIFFTYDSMRDHYLQIHSFQFTTINVDVEDQSSEKSIDEIEERSKHEFDFFFCGKCSICDQTFDKTITGLGVYSSHIISDHSDNKDMLKYFTYTCSRCETPHSTLNYLQSHWEKHCFEKWKNENKNNQKNVCENCGMQFANEKSLCCHIKIFHQLAAKVICEECGSSFSTQMYLKQHIKIVHHGEFKFPCDYCERKFKCKGTALKHTRRVHLAEKPFACDVCDKLFFNKAQLQFHVNTHTGEKPYKCKYCDKGFAARSAVTSHEGTHKGHTCKMCGKSFTQYNSLCAHRKVAHSHSGTAKGEISVNENKALPNDDYQRRCDICDKTFANDMNLYAHKLYAHGDKKFVCDICGKSYNRPLSLRRHKYSHDTIERFGCSSCDETFRTPEKFYTHKRNAHLNDAQDAILVRLISEKKSISATKKNQSTNVANFVSVNISKKASEKPQTTLQINIQTSKEQNIIDHQITASNISLDPENSSGLEDFSSELPFDDEFNGNETPVAHNLIDELEDVNTQSKMLIASNAWGDSSSENHAMIERNTEVRHSGLSNLIDFSRANVPSGIALTAVEKPKNNKKKSKQKYKVFIEDEEKDELITDVKIQQLVNVKIEATSPADIKEDKSSVCNDEIDCDSNNGENDFQTGNGKAKLTNTAVNFPQDPYSPCLMVKLTRLLEYKCVPCKKLIFATSQREIRQHSKTHRLTISQKIKRKRKDDTADRRKRCYVFDCNYCEKKSFTVNTIISHCLEAHPGKNPIKCKMCSETFKYSYAYYTHKNRKHNPQKLIAQLDPTAKGVVCEVCGKIFSTKIKLYTHNYQVHRGQTYPCTVCSRTFTSKGNMETHIKRMHSGGEGKTHLCEECGNAFFTTTELNLHVNQVHKKIKRQRKVKPNTNSDVNITHSCNVCSHKLPTEKRLQKHLLFHDPQRKYACDVCGWRFSHYNNLMTHKQITHKIYGPRSKKAKAGLLAVELGVVSYGGQ